jgi:hypothetical protein
VTTSARLALAVASTRPRRALGCAPAERIAADKAAMLALPPVAPQTGWHVLTRLARDHYARLDANDYSVHPAVIGRRRLDRGGGSGPFLPRPGLRRPGQRLHQPQHHVHDLEPDAPGRMLKDAGGIPAHGNQRSEWDAGCRFDFENPDYR